MRHHRRPLIALALVALALVALFAAPAVALEIVIQPNGTVGQDTWIGADNPAQTHGDEDWLHFGGNLSGPDEFRLYIRFDLSALDPSSTVDTAQLELYQFVHNGWIEYNYSVMQVTGAWTESTLSWNTQPTFEPVAVTAFSGSTWQGGIQMWHAIPGLETLVQHWIDNPEQNHGLMIKPTDNFYGYAQIWSSDYTSSVLRPRLVINGEIVANDGSDWGSVKRLYR